MGIDRMAMFLTDNYSIREVLTFPFVKPLPNAAPNTGGLEKRMTAAELVGVEPMQVEDVDRN